MRPCLSIQAEKQKGKTARKRTPRQVGGVLFAAAGRVAGLFYQFGRSSLSH